MSIYELENVGVNQTPHVEIENLTTAFERRIREFNINNVDFKSLEEFFSAAFQIYEMELRETVNQFEMLKTTSYFCAELKRAFALDDEDRDPLIEKRTVYIPSQTKIINKFTNLSEHYQNNIVNYTKNQMDEVMIEGSGFTLDKIIKLTVQIFKYQPLKGSGYIELPEKLKKHKYAVINLKNTDEECFKWAILCALHYDEVYARSRNNAKNVSKYLKWKDELNFDGIDFPMQLSQINKFMSQNEPIAVNVYYFDSEEECIRPLFLAMKPIESRYIHLLLLTETVRCKPKAFEIDVKSHFCWIKNFGALMRSQATKNRGKLFVCDRCLNYFYSQDKLNEHKIICILMNKCAIELPLPGENFETFKNFKNELKVPFVIYADTETLLKQPEKAIFSEDCSTRAHQQHEMHSIGYYFMCDSEIDDEISYYSSHRGADCLEWFMHELVKIATAVFECLEDTQPMWQLTVEQQDSFNLSTHCHICKKIFTNDEQPTSIRVKDHCHMTGAYRGAAHQSCNLNYQVTRSIPVVFHNLSGYDSHLLIKMLGSNKEVSGDITIIPQNSEKYISFIKKVTPCSSSVPFWKHQREIKFKFIDSLRFMSASLDYLASLIPNENKQILKSECEKYEYSEEQFHLLTRKGVFPYEYIDKFEKLNEISLPPKESFYSMLSQSHISNDEYEHAQKVWEKFRLRTLGEYSDLYLKTDVLLLADVFENFRNTCLTTYSLDPAHYFGAAGLSFDAMLKYTGISIELFTDVDMLLFAERGIRGGVSQINKRYVRANNQYMDEEFDPSNESTYLMYLDGKYFDFTIFFVFVCLKKLIFSF